MCPVSSWECNLYDVCARGCVWPASDPQGQLKVSDSNHRHIIHQQHARRLQQARWLLFWNMNEWLFMHNHWVSPTGGDLISGGRPRRGERGQGGRGTADSTKPQELAEKQKWIHELFNDRTRLHFHTDKSKKQPIKYTFINILVPHFHFFTNLMFQGKSFYFISCYLMK